MKAKKILGWIIVIAAILGLILVSTFIVMLDCKVSFLCGLGAVIIALLIIVAISVLISLAIEWITD